MNVRKRRLTRERYVICDDRGRYLYRHWSKTWDWTTRKVDARVFRNKGAAEKRAATVGGHVVALTS